MDDQCTQCGVCAEVCPTGAVDPQDSSKIDQEKCITCCACIKSCPQNARTIKASPVKDAQTRLNNLFKEPKSPGILFVTDKIMPAIGKNVIPIIKVI